MTNKTILGSALVLILVTTMTSFGAYADTSPTSPQDGTQYKFYEISSSSLSSIVGKWIKTYDGLYQGVTIKSDYVNSNNAIYQYTKRVVPIVNSDTPLGSGDAKKVSDALIIPNSVHTVAIVYNIPGFKQSGLKLNGTVLANIYLGKIIYWNDPKIQSLNPGTDLPNARITPIHRSDASGLTYTFTEYLSSESKTWKTSYGKGTTVSWKTNSADQSLKGDSIIAFNVSNTPYSIGYSDLGNAIKYKETYAAIQNGDGTKFVIPSLEATSAAASASSGKFPEANGDWSKVSIINAPGTNSYPIVGFNYILTYQNLDKIKGLDKNTANTIVDQIYWDVTDGQKYLAPLSLAQLPGNVTELDERGLGDVNFKGSQLYAYDGFVVEPAQ
jgi:phosphate transport system substrate-binding protein